MLRGGFFVVFCALFLKITQAAVGDCPTNENLFDCEFPNVTICVPTASTCDGHDDCCEGMNDPDCVSLDEAPETCPDGTTCVALEFHCGTGQCIPDQFVCNGIDDCPDGSDEVTCPPAPTPVPAPPTVTVCAPSEFDCGDGTCIPGDERCDGWDDCPNNSDEKNCPGNIQQPSTLKINVKHRTITIKGDRDVDDIFIVVVCQIPTTSEFFDSSCRPKFPEGSEDLHAFKVQLHDEEGIFSDEIDVPHHKNVMRGFEDWEITTKNVDFVVTYQQLNDMHTINTIAINNSSTGSGPSAGVIAAAIVIPLIVCVCAVVVFVYYRRKKRQKTRGLLLGNF